MSITYQDIISVLCKKKNKFSTNLNIMKFVDQFKYFKEIFSNEFYRYGIHIYNNEYENISFISSILYCLDDNYCIIDKDYLFNKISQIKEFIKEDINIVNHLDVNILIFDFQSNKIKSLYEGDYLNPYKDTIFLANYENYWEPICSKESKIFNIINKSNIFKNKIFYQEIEYFNDDKIFVLNDNIAEIVEHKFGEILENEESFTTKNSMYSNLTKNKLNKMNKNDILEIINDLNIDIKSLKKPTKITLINLILEN